MEEVRDKQLNGEMKKRSPYKLTDPTNTILLVIGIGLLISFFSPIIFQLKDKGTQLVFLNIEILLVKGRNPIPGMVIFQMVYPLFAGILMIFASKWQRSVWKAATLLTCGLLPFVIFFSNPPIKEALSNLDHSIPDRTGLDMVMLLSIISVLFLLSGAHTVRVNPEKKFAGYLAAFGGALFLISLFIPFNGKFAFLNSFKTMFASDSSGAGYEFAKGFIKLLEDVLMIIIAVRSFWLLRHRVHKALIGRNIFTLWLGFLGVLGASILNEIIAEMMKIETGKGTFLLVNVTILIKFIPWLLALFHLIPLGIGEFLLLRPAVKFKFNVKKVSAAAVSVIVVVIAFVILKPGPKLSKEASLALINAVRINNLEEVKRLIEKERADVNFLYQGKTPLHYAVEKGNVEIARELLERVDVNIIDKYGYTPLYYASLYGKTEIVRMLLDKKADVNNKPLEGDSSLIAAVSGGHIDIVRQLIDANARVDAAGSNGETALKHALRKRYMKIVQILVEAGAEFPWDEANSEGQNYLITAIKKGSFELVKTLIDQGGDINARGEFEPAAANLGNRKRKEYSNTKGKVFDVTPLLTAIWHHKFKAARLLIDKGCRVNDLSTAGESPLMAAAEKGNLELIQLLLEKGADLNHNDYMGQTALHYAVKHDPATTSYINYLKDKSHAVQKLIDLGMDVNAVDFNGNTPLHAAIKQGTLEEVKVLLANGADRHAKNFMGKTPLDYVYKGTYARGRDDPRWRKIEIAKYLKSLDSNN